MSASDSLLAYRNAGERGLNFFEDDPAFRRALEECLPAAGRERAFSRLSAFGALCGGELGRLIEEAHRPENRPRLRRFDAVGNRVEAVDYCLAQRQARVALARAVYGEAADGLTVLALSYLANQNGEGGITCPLAMTDGLIRLLQACGTERQRSRWLPVLRSCDPETALPAGQYVTERQGGSNVSANETLARPLADGSWSLTGLKWFCSNPGEVWATTARLEGTSTIALFLMPRRLEDGALNAHRVLRLKEIAGTRGKATAEVEYLGARAELLGRPAQGLALLVRRLLWVSRVHVVAAALGFWKRALREAELFAREREAFGRPIAAVPSVARELSRLREGQERGLRAYFRAMALDERGDPAGRALVPLLKTELSRRASDAVRRSQLVVGGHGILEDFSILPRLAEDAVVNEIWEGTHPILAEHAAKALRRPAVLEAVLAALPPGPAAGEIRRRCAANRAMSDDERGLDSQELCSLVYDAFCGVN